MSIKSFILIFTIVLISCNCLLCAEEIGSINLDENVLFMANDTYSNIYYLTLSDKTYYIKNFGSDHSIKTIGDFKFIEKDEGYNLRLEFPNAKTVRLSFYTFNNNNTLKIYYYLDFPKALNSSFSSTEKIFDKIKTERSKRIPINYDLTDFEITNDLIDKSEIMHKKIMFNESAMTTQSSKFCQFDTSFIATSLITDSNNDAYIILSYLKKNGDVKHYVKINIPNEQEEYQVYTSMNRIYINVLLQTVARNWSFSRIYIFDKKGHSQLTKHINPKVKKLRTSLIQADTTYLKSYLDSLAMHNHTDSIDDYKRLSEEEKILYSLVATFYNDQLNRGFNVNGQSFNSFGTNYTYVILKHRIDVNLVKPSFFNRQKNLSKIKYKINQKYYFRPDIKVKNKKLIYLDKANELLLTEAFTNDMKLIISKLLNVSKGGDEICPNLITEVNLTRIILSNELDEALICTKYNNSEFNFRYRLLEDKWEIIEQ